MRRGGAIFGGPVAESSPVQLRPVLSQSIFVPFVAGFTSGLVSGLASDSVRSPTTYVVFDLQDQATVTVRMSTAPEEAEITVSHLLPKCGVVGVDDIVSHFIFPLLTLHNIVLRPLRCSKTIGLRARTLLQHVGFSLQT